MRRILRPGVRQFRFMLFLCLLAPSLIQAQTGFAGKWRWTATGGGQQITLDLKANGNQLSGTITMEQAVLPATAGGKSGYFLDPETPLDELRAFFFPPVTFSISEGKIAGNTISFTQTTSATLATRSSSGMPFGQTRSVTEKLYYSGQLSGDRIQLTRTYKGVAANPWIVGAHSVAFSVSALEVNQMRFFAIVPAIVITTVWAFSQTPPASQLATAVEVDVAALDATGRINTSLNQSDFSILEDGVAQKITEFMGPDAGKNVLLLFDHNDTWLAADSPTNPSSLWNQMQAGILRFINSLMPKDRMAIAAFEDHITTVLPWRTRSGPPLTAKLSEITSRPSAGKNLYGALEWAASQFKDAKGRKAAIVFTDGRDARLAPRWFQSEDRKEVLDPLAGLIDSGEQSEFADALTIVRRSGMQVYFIAPYPDHSAQFTGPSGNDYHLNGISGNSTLAADYLNRVRSRMEQIAETSGGRIFYLDKPEDAPGTYSQLSTTLAFKESYHIVYVPTARLGSKTFHRIEVRIRDGEFRAALSRAGYYDK